MTCPFLKRNGEGMDWEGGERWGVRKWEEREYGEVKVCENWNGRRRQRGKYDLVIFTNI